MNIFRSHRRSKFTDESLVQYLLGTGLSTQERDEIEDAYFHDDDTFQRAQEIELELVESYKSGQLPEERRKLVSDLVARSAKLREHAQFVEALRRTAFRTVGAATSDQIEWMRVWLSIWGVWKFASVIATILLIAFIPFVLWRAGHATFMADEKPAKEIPRLQERGLRERVSLGESEPNAVRPDAEFVDLVSPEAPPDCRLQSITMSNLDRNEAIPRDRLTWYESAGGKSSHIVISVSRSNLKPGNWRVTVTSTCGTPTQTRTAEYHFGVR
jgi:hypothetical protein